MRSASRADRAHHTRTYLTDLPCRQRQTNASTTPFALAQRYLPRELLQEVRLPVPAPVKGSKRKKPQRAGAEDAEVAST